MTQCSYSSTVDYPVKDGEDSRKHHCQIEVESQNSTFCYFHSATLKDHNEFFYLFKQYIEEQIRLGSKVICIGFNFPDFSYHGNGYVNEPGTWVFDNDVFFLNCNFKKFYLQEVYFNKNAYFDNAKFNGDMEFNYCQFKGNVSFEKVTWNKDFFMKAAFGEKVDFHDCQLNGDTKFQVTSHIPVYEKITFRVCYFNNLTSFSGSNFQGQNLFDNCTFNKSVDFNGSSFINQINSKNPCTVKFKFCLFNEEVEFVRTRFPIQLEKILAKPRIPKIKGKSKNSYRSYETDNKEELRDFFNKYFQGNFNDKDDIRVLFWKLQINSTKINFNFIDRIKHKLFGINRFEKSFCIDKKKHRAIIIIKNQMYKPITTKGKNFLARFFYYENDFSDYYDAPIDFDYSTFRKRVRFIGSPDKPLSLCAVSFRGTELSNFEFHNVEWIQRRNLLKHRYILIDELLLEKKGNYDEVSSIYNQLRKNYETKLLFNESSNFFIGEMESIRKSLWKKNRSVYRLSALPYFLYKIFALYGESLKLPLIWTFVIIGGIAILDCLYYSKADLLTSIKNSTFNFLPISWILPQNSPNIDLYYIEKLFSLIVFGSLFIALRRRFERRK